MKNVLKLVVVAAVLLAAAQAHAAIIMVNADLDGLQEVSPVATPGFGSAVITFDTETRNVSLVGTFSDLIGTTTAAHVHGFAPAGTNAGVLFNLVIDVGVTSGSFSGNATLTESQFQSFLANLTYINVHTDFRHGGEIRGQIIVPEPASAALLAAGTALILLRRRKAA